MVLKFVVTDFLTLELKWLKKEYCCLNKSFGYPLPRDNHFCSLSFSNAILYCLEENSNKFLKIVHGYGIPTGSVHINIRMQQDLNLSETCFILTKFIQVILTNFIWFGVEGTFEVEMSHNVAETVYIINWDSISF